MPRMYRAKAHAKVADNVYRITPAAINYFKDYFEGKITERYQRGRQEQRLAREAERIRVRVSRGEWWL